MKRILCAAALTAVAAPAVAAEDGASLFQQNCAACHQAKGQGVAGAFPPLAGNKFVQGDPKGPAYVVTHGRGGMPNFSDDLDDQQMAAILTYVRTSWGNGADRFPDPTLVAIAARRGAHRPAQRHRRKPAVPLNRRDMWWPAGPDLGPGAPAHGSSRPWPSPWLQRPFWPRGWPPGGCAPT